MAEVTEMSDKPQQSAKKAVKSGITFGSALAMVISYTTWHCILSWVYVIYFIIRY